MADKKKPDPSLPGDLVQLTDQTPMRGVVALVTEVRKRGIGVTVPVLREDGVLLTRYERLAVGSFVTVGVAALLPPEVQKARTEAVETARLVAADLAGAKRGG